jgi:RNA methyltransferase, TrmH family
VPLSTDVLRSLLRRKGRREHGLFLLEGPSLLEEALTSDLELLEVRATREATAEQAELIRRAAEAGAPYIEITEKAASRLSDVETPSGIVAVARIATRSLEDVLARRGLILLLAGVADPGNAGTLVRSAEAFGASGILFGEGGVEPYNPKVVRSAMGSLFRLPHAVVSAEALMEEARRSGRQIIAADRSGQSLRGFGFPENPILAIGSERGGVSAWLSRWDATVAVPHRGPTESLNAAIAGAIVLYEWSFSPGFRAKK